MRYVVLLVSCGGLLAAEPARLRIEVRNQAHAPRSTVLRAESEVARILRDAGIEVNWVECRADSDDSHEVRTGHAIGLVRLTLSIVPDVPAYLPLTTLGVASAEPAGSMIVRIFYPRVTEAVATNEIVSLPKLLGAVATHEIGHLFLGLRAHSAVGLMKAHWSRWELQLALVEQLRFNSEQSAKMQAEIVRRGMPGTTPLPDRLNRPADYKTTSPRPNS